MFNVHTNNCAGAHSSNCRYVTNTTSPLYQSCLNAVQYINMTFSYSWTQPSVNSPMGVGVINGVSGGVRH